MERACTAKRLFASTQTGCTSASGACAPDTYSLRAGADPALSKTAIGAAAGSCIAAALAALALLYAWYRRRSAVSVSADCFPGAKGRQVLQPGLSVPAGSLTLRVRCFARNLLTCKSYTKPYRLLPRAKARMPVACPCRGLENNAPCTVFVAESTRDLVLVGLPRQQRTAGMLHSEC